jgi:TonB family protein
MFRRLAFAFLCVLAFSTADAKRYTGAELRAMFWRAPRPDYPIELVRLRLAGTGVYRIYLDERGEVTGIRILQKTGVPPLDIEVLKTLVRWRAWPGPKREVDLPITFIISKR